MTRVQFTSKENPGGTPLLEARMDRVPGLGEYVALPGRPPAVVSRVMWAWDEDGTALGAAVVLG